MGKEFLKLENKLVLELEIEPLSPLIVKLGDGSEENSKNEKSESVISFVTSDSPRMKRKRIIEKEKYLFQVLH